MNEVICLSNYILPPLPQCDIQINTFPLVFVRLTLFFFPVFKTLLFILPGSLSCSSSCPCFASSYFLSYCSPLLLFSTLSPFLPASSMPAGALVFRSKESHGKRLASTTAGVTVTESFGNSKVQPSDRGRQQERSDKMKVSCHL